MADIITPEDLLKKLDPEKYKAPMEWADDPETSVYKGLISHPAHYTEGFKYEPEKVIRDWGLNFNLGNVVKYCVRAGRKGDALVDILKARQYLDFEIRALKEEAEGFFDDDK